MLPGRYQGRTVDLVGAFEMAGKLKDGSADQAEVIRFESQVCPTAGSVRRAFHGQLHELHDRGLGAGVAL